MRVVNKHKRCISYTLNILGIRVFEEKCELIAKHGDQWVPIGNAKQLPLDVQLAADPQSDPLLLTISQYSVTFPDSDLVAVLRGARSIDQALNGSASVNGSA